MKTTIDIPDSLMRQVKRLAAARGVTIRAIVEAALRDALSRRSQPRGRFRLQTHTYGGNGLQPGLAWDDWSAIRSLGYEGRGG